jgi:hypothetical protein
MIKDVGLLGRRCAGRLGWRRESGRREKEGEDGRRGGEYGNGVVRKGVGSGEKAVGGRRGMSCAREVKVEILRSWTT